jgi:hypothetical protein
MSVASMLIPCSGVRSGAGLVGVVTGGLTVTGTTDCDDIFRESAAHEHIGYMAFRTIPDTADSQQFATRVFAWKNILNVV